MRCGTAIDLRAKIDFSRPIQCPRCGNVMIKRGYHDEKHAEDFVYVICPECKYKMEELLDDEANISALGREKFMLVNQIAETLSKIALSIVKMDNSRG
ncbi:MAG: hypothetical protein IJU76_04550 [Desulfovibrionaceae bacterium]|nr:hypothetical protein [Desulfovibrionaceae bacterium]